MNNNQDLVNNENNIINNYIKKLYTDECSSFTDEPSNVCSSDVIETCGDCMCTMQGRYVKDGEYVKKGDVILSFDTKEARRYACKIWRNCRMFNS